MPAMTLSAKLDRSDGSTPWGFRLQGGKDFSAPLTIQRVTPGSLADKCGLKPGDILTKIGGTSVEQYRHKDAQHAILTAGNSLELTLTRGAAPFVQQSYSPAPAQPAPAASFPAYQPKPAQPSFQAKQNYNPSPKPFIAGGSNVPTVVNKQYNTPINVYSVDNVMDTLAGQTQAMGIKAEPPSAGSSVESSATYKLVHDSEARASSPSMPAPSPASLNTNHRTSPPNQSARCEDHKNTSSPPTQSARYEDHKNTKSPPKQSARYEEQNGEEIHYQGYTNPNAQSRTFKMLQGMIDKGEDLPTSFAVGTPPKSKPPENVVVQKQENIPTVKAVVNSQYNTPIKMYSQQNIEESYTVQTADLDNADSGEPGGPKPFKLHESETYKLLKEEEKGDNHSEPSTKNPSRTFNILQRQLDHQPAAAPAPVAAPAAPTYGSPAQHAAAAPRSAPFKPSMPAPGPVAKPAPVRVGAWQPKIPTGPRNPVFGKRGDAKSMGPAVGRVPVCSGCGSTIRGPFVLALDMSWCPDHFMCANPNCRQSLVESGFVEEGGQLFCERDYEQFFAPRCAKCNKAIIGDCVNALQKTFHPHCFVCAHCRQPIGKGSFHIEDGQQYCDKDWQAMFQTKCQGCQFPIEPGDKWVEALNANWHSECFNCSTCQVNLEGQAFFAKGGHPYCKRHASGGRF